MKQGSAGLQNGGRGGGGGGRGGGGLQLIMPENITNEMVMKSNGKWFGRLGEEEKLPAWDYVTVLTCDCYDGNNL